MRKFWFGNLKKIKKTMYRFECHRWKSFWNKPSFKPFVTKFLCVLVSEYTSGLKSQLNLTFYLKIDKKFDILQLEKANVKKFKINFDYYHSIKCETLCQYYKGYFKGKSSLIDQLMPPKT